MDFGKNVITKLQFVSPGEGLSNDKMGYQACPKIHVKRVIFHNSALYVCNMNRASNSCKIGLKGYDFLEILRIYRVVFMQILCMIPGYDIWTSYLLRVVLPSFVMFFVELCV